jgi:hypothetical protein
MRCQNSSEFLTLKNNFVALQLHVSRLPMEVMSPALPDGQPIGKPIDLPVVGLLCFVVRKFTKNCDSTVF